MNAPRAGAQSSPVLRRNGRRIRSGGDAEFLL